MTDGIQISSFSSRKVNKLAEFAKTEYGVSEISNEKYLEWQYYQNPNGDALITLAQNEEGKIVAQYVALPLQYSVKGKLLNGSLSLNTLTRPDYRGRGLFKKTAERTYQRCAESGILFTIGVPNKNSFQGFIDKLNFKHAGNLTFLVKPLRHFEIIKSLFRAKGKKGVEIDLSFPAPKLNSEFLSDFNTETDRIIYSSFLQEWETKKTICLHRSPEYLLWRYEKNPIRNYYLIKHVEEGKMNALLIFRTLYVYGLRAVVIMELSCLPGFSVKKFIQPVLRNFRKNKIDIVMSVAADRNLEYRQLKGAGFVPVPKIFLPQQLPVIIRQHNQFENSNLLLDLSNWHFTFGDYDIF